MRFLLALIFVLGFSLQVLAQTTSDTSSLTWTPSGTWTRSGTWTPSGTWTSSGSATATWSSSSSISGTISGTATPSRTYPQPPAPTGVENRCKGHIITICPGWAPPAGFKFNLYRVYYTLQGSGVIESVDTHDVSTLITNLVPNSLYDVTVQGVDTNVGVWSANTTTQQMATDPADPKEDPSLDVQNFDCVKTTNPTTGRGAIQCSWTAAAVTVRQVNFKVKCVSNKRRPLLVRKRRYGTKANETTVLFAINRDTATCKIKARFYYARRPTARKTVRISF